MPVKRTRSKSSRRLDDYQRYQLLEGPDDTLLAGSGYLGLVQADGPFEFMPEEDQRTILADMEADWHAHGAELMEWWNAGRDAPHFSPKPWIFPFRGDRELPWAAQRFGLPKEAESDA